MYTGEPFPNKTNYRNLGFKKATYCGIPVYVRDNGDEKGIDVCRRNIVSGFLFEVVAWICINIRRDEGFYFKVLIED